MFMREQAHDVMVADEVDVCVLGGSCTGVFAAIRAARLGLKVAIVEQTACFGGVATNGGVCIWHSLLDTNFEHAIIGGLTKELLERLGKRPMAMEFKGDNKPPYRMKNIMNYYINTEELKIELDEMILENSVKPFLHTFFCAPIVEEDQLVAVAIENKSGRQAIRAKAFVDATADGDLAIRLGEEEYYHETLQPATAMARMYQPYTQGTNTILAPYREQLGMHDIGWDCPWPGAPEVANWCKSNVVCNCANGDELTRAEIEARRQTRAMSDILRNNGFDKLSLVALGGRIAPRETRQVRCLHSVTFDEARCGQSFEDAIMKGAYPMDIHHSKRIGATYYYLDGVQEDTNHGLSPNTLTRWREPIAVDPTYYQLPLRSMIPAKKKYGNIIVCGRAIDADKGAFSGLRVMVNMNQTGEAAGVTAALHAASQVPIWEIDPQVVRRTMNEGGSLL